MGSNDIPRSIGNRYFREIRGLIEENRSNIWTAFQKEIIPRIHQYRNLTANRLTVNDPYDEIRRITNRLRQQGERVFSIPIVERIVRRFVEDMNNNQKRRFGQRMSRVLGFDPTRNEPWLSSFLETAIQDNVNWIKSIQSEYHDKIETIITQGVRRGSSIRNMASEIAEVGNVEVRRARFIARDQMGSIHGDLTKRRQEESGIKRFRWSTSGDERVRDSHEDLDGEIFEWSKGATNERGETIWPGTDYNCRCTAEPVLEDLLEDD
ncbi:phage head morphogenesis protein [Desertibacillus haloalkaliphilus]|uniref:phage head morphogenesis protein n=1 Tax=Desertibacillus haloalkaliphilus TaxID=1328930 RepID=UPI001C26E77D|nr:phage minor head protein [Desertibacillus haloalkaliphilus]MBU8908510.1 minor capsid protein [Desertibacillus haloalkaliphilus]